MTISPFQAVTNAGTVIIRVETTPVIDQSWTQGCTQLNEYGKVRQEELRHQTEKDREVAKKLLLK
jgi:hypothetical protein